MKRILLLLTLFCALFSTVKATEVTIGDPTSTTYSYYFPIRTYYKYAFNQQIFTADEIGMAGTINSITLNIKGSATLTTPRVFDIYMAEVEDTVFATSSSWVGLSADDLVYSGTETFTDPTAQEITFALETPFAYSGQGSLVIAFNNTTGEYQGTSTDGVQTLVFGSSTDSKKTIYANRDGDPGQYDVTTPGVTGTLSGQRNVITLSITTGGGPTIQCDKPTDLEALSVTANTATLSWAGGSGLYNVEIKAPGADDWSFVLKNTALTTYDLTELVPNSNYQVRVQSVCDGDNTSGYKTASFKTMIGIPYTEPFSGTSIPTGWIMRTGQLQPNGTASLSGTSGWVFGSNNGVFDNHARSNIYGTGCYKWLISPAIPVPELGVSDPGYQLSFLLALTKFSGTLQEVDKSQQLDDRFIVLVSADSMQTWQILREWNNTGSEYVYNDIAVAGEEVDNIDMSAYAGQTIMLAFYGESTASGGDNNIHVDDVLIEKTPTCLKPTRLGEVEGSASKNSIQISWEHAGAQAFLIQYKKASDADYADPITVTPNPENNVYTYTLTGLDEFTEYNVRVAAYCDPTDPSTLTDYCKVVTVKTASGVPFNEAFNHASWPNDWKRYDALLAAVQSGAAELEATADGWKEVTKANGNNVFDSAYHAMINIAGETCKYWAVSPTIEMEAGYELSFNLALTKTDGSAVEAGGQPDDIFAVLVYADGTWISLRTWSATSEYAFDEINSSANGQVIKLDLSAYANKNIQIAFYAQSTATNGNNNLHIANVLIDLIPACSPALSLDIADLTATSANAVWTAEGEGTWQYGLVMNPAADFAPTDELYTATIQTKSASLTDLTPMTTYAFFVRKACEGGYSDPLVRIFTTTQVPVELPYDNDFETENGWVFANGPMSNKWYWGSATNNTTGGSKAIYISSNNGLTNAYNNLDTATVYASKLFDFVEPGMYTFSFDWKAYGESSFDYIRVALVSAETELVASTKLPTGMSSTALPQGWIALDGGSKLNLDSTWQHHNEELTINKAGKYKMVFVWRNDYSGGSDPAGAVDNIHIARMACAKPTGLLMSEVGDTTAVIAWDEDQDMNWAYAYAPANEPAPAPEAFVEIHQNSLSLTGLAIDTEYKFYLHKVCGETTSEDVTITFKTNNPYLFMINAGASTTSSYLPFYGLYAQYESNNGQFIVPADSLEGIILWDSISALTFHSSSTYKNVSWGNARWEVYMAEASAATLSDFVDWDAMTKVKEADSMVVVDQVMKVNLDYPYQYKGGNLLIGFKQTATGTGASCSWQAKSINGLGYSSYKSSATATTVTKAVRNYLPKLGVVIIPGEAPACPRPSHLAVIDSTITSNSAALDWTFGGAEANWLVQYKKSTDEEWIYATDSVNTHPFTLSGLEASTVYDVRVAAWCGAETSDSTAVSDFTSAISFATLCEPYSIAQKGNYKEGFELYEGASYNSKTGVAPVCWEVAATNSTGVKPHVIAPSDTYAYIHSGEKALTFYGSGYCYAALPEFADSLKFLRISFWSGMENVSNGTLKLGYITNDDPDTFHEIATYESSLKTNMVQHVTDLNNVPDAAARLVFQWYYSSQYSCCIDDIEVMYIPNCLEPVDLVAVDSLITMNSAVLTWTAQGDETEWVLQYKKHAAEEWTSIVATNNTLLLENLESATMYDARVAAKCGAEELSPFTAQISFVTACGAYSIAENGAFTEGFEAYEGAAYNATTGIIPNCWEASTTNSSNIAPHVIKPTDTYAYIHSGEKALTFYGSGYCYAVLPEFVEPLNTLQISFWAAMESATNGTLKLGYITEANPDVFHEIATYDRTAAKVMAPYETVLNALPDSAARLVFEWYYSGQWSCCIDDIEVSFIPNCLKPTNLAVDSIANHAALISWTAENEETAWAVQYKKSADSIWLDAPVANDTIYLLENLAAATSYDVQVSAICSESERSAYSAAISFITDCDARTEFPYVEGFDSIAGVTSGHVMPLCWNYINTCTYSSYSYYPTVYKSTTYANTPDNALRFYSYGYSATYDPQDQYAILPEVENVSGLKLKFNARKYSTSYAADFYVGVMTDASDTATFEALAHINPTGTTYEAYEIPFNHYEGNGQFIAIKMIAPTSSYKGFFIDDVVVEKLPACMQPENLEVSDITASSATIKWVNGTADQNAWQIVYSCDPQFNIADVTEAEIIDVASNPYALAELTVDTLYNVYVRANCGGEDGVSAWSTISFHTASACQTPTDLAAADITATSASISWNGYGQTGFNLRYSINGTLWLDTIYNITGAPYVLDQLLANEDYYVQVQNDCNVEEWSESLHFKTTCVAWSIANDGDYVEDFDSYTGTAYNAAGVAPDCWEIGGTSTYVPHVVTGTSYAWTHSGINSFGFTGSANSYCYAVLPQFEEDLNRLQISLWTRMESTSYGTLSLGYITADEDMIYLLKNYTSVTTMTNYVDALDTIPAEATRLVLLWQYSGASYYSCTIDDLEVSFIPTCLKPEAVTATEIAGHSAKIGWTPGAEGQTAWQIAYDTLPSKQPDTLTNIINVTENPYMLTGLNPLTKYYVYVRANCGEQDGLSKWSDQKTFTTTVACPAPTGLKATLTPGNGTIATLTWNAGDAQAWSVEYSLNANMSDSLVVNVSTPVADLTGLTPEATYYARVKADCGELDGESTYSAVLSFTPTDKYEIVVNDGTTTNNYVPVYGSYVDNATGTRSQFIVPEAALEEIEWDSIKALTFYSSADTSEWGNAQFEVYMMEAPEATMTELADWTAMTKVMNTGFLTVSNKKMVVTFDEPYQYQGGNLMIGIYQTVTSGGDYKSMPWYGVTAQGASFGGYGNGNQVQQRNFLPKMTIEYAPGVAPACPKAKNLVIDEITDNSAVASWKAVEGATWEYALVEGNAIPTAFIPTTEDTVELSNLADATAYTFYLRKACGEAGNSEMISATFTTEQHIEALPYEEDFEGANYFKFVQAEQTNAWVIGNATSNGGDKALYISNDGGVSNAYATNVANASFATILINFAERGSYAISYDWMANGDYDDEGELELYDYLRVALVPAEAVLVAGTPALPEGAIALDNGGLYGATTWQHMALANVQIYDGLYKLVFAWINDNADGNQTPAAIDNISIVRTGGMTDIEGGAGIENTAIKFIHNDQVYILLNGTVYTITGQKVELK